ncbi:MAG TPA: hypothetical protein VD969_07705 [Symbiobacteriaceae bacterium]|nr:hypothetical protein [Symbiobacteriaceae bacterium]
MANQLIQVPASLLLSPDLGESAKLTWMVSRLHNGPGEPGTSWLAAASGLSRRTAQTSKAQLAAWVTPKPAPANAPVPVPAALLTNHQLGVQARLFYGILLLTPGYGHPGGHFTFEELSALAHVTPKTAARAIDELKQAEWIKTEQANRLARIQFELTFPGFDRGLAALDAAGWSIPEPTNAWSWTGTITRRTWRLNATAHSTTARPVGFQRDRPHTSGSATT